MRFTRLGSHALAVLFPIVVSGCSSGGTQFSPSAGPGQQSQQRQPVAASSGLAFFSDWGNAVIDIFSTQTLKQTGQITSVCEPDGLATDKHGNLYEADQCSHKVQIYAPNDVGKPTSTIPDFGYLPAGVAVDTAGNIYLANIESNGAGQGNVIRFDAKTRSRTLLRGAPYFPFCLAMDASGNLWADGQSYRGYAVIGFWKNATGMFNHVNISFKFPGQLQFDSAGNLILNDQSGSSNGGSELFVYPPGSTNPIRSIPIQNDGSDIVSFVLEKDNARIFAPDVTNSNIYLYGYKSGELQATLRPSITGGSLIGAAVIPAPSP